MDGCDVMDAAGEVELPHEKEKEGCTKVSQRFSTDTDAEGWVE
jgi:hypothetical protein